MLDLVHLSTGHIIIIVIIILLIIQQTFVIMRVILTFFTLIAPFHPIVFYRRKIQLSVTELLLLLL